MFDGEMVKKKSRYKNFGLENFWSMTESKTRVQDKSWT